MKVIKQKYSHIVASYWVSVRDVLMQPADPYNWHSSTNTHASLWAVYFSKKHFKNV
jgi:hypothetical protein